MTKSIINLEVHFNFICWCVFYYKIYRTSLHLACRKIAHGLHLLACILKAFHCRHGKAYLFNKITNFTVGETEERMMMTGVHSVCDIFCVGCGSIVGWKYVAAQEKSQRYKEGKFILERFQVLGPEGTLYYFNNNTEASGSEPDDM
ncbi:hypothetical protein MKX01_012665 [Papaver californicum]|nr:hypothetical protein MKX01_012665 [Papaver californicum]